MADHPPMTGASAGGGSGSGAAMDGKAAETMGLSGAATRRTMKSTGGSKTAGGMAGPPRASRAAEALKMKDQQLGILQEQNAHLLKSLDQVEDEANRLQVEKLAIDEELRGVRDKYHEVESKGRADAAALKRARQDAADKDRQLKIMTDQNAELLRLLEREEKQAGELQEENAKLRSELIALRQQHEGLVKTANAQEELAAQAAREAQLRSEELRVSKEHAAQLKSSREDEKRKATVEIESLQEQLRVRKEKQYSLLERAQQAEEAQRRAEDQVIAMEERVKELSSRMVELETQLQVEQRSKAAQQEANKQLANEEGSLRQQVLALQRRVEAAEAERVRLEAEGRDTGEQLREMAEKVFQLLERLKLAELGKTKAVEAVRTRESEISALRKKAGRLLKESNREGGARVKAEMELKALQDTVRALRQHNGQLAARTKEEARAKLKEHEERKVAEDKVRTLSGRLTFLLNKLQADEEAKASQREEIKKLEAQLKAATARAEDLADQLSRVGESNRVVTETLRGKTQELETAAAERDAYKRRLAEEQRLRSEDETMRQTGAAAAGGGLPPEDVAALRVEPGNDAVMAAGGRGRFYVEVQESQGFVLLRAARSSARALLEKLRVNEFLRRSQRGQHFRERAVEKMSELLGLLLVTEEKAVESAADASEARGDAEGARQLTSILHERLAGEEEARRRTLLRYLSTIKHVAAIGAPMPGADPEAPIEGGVVQLEESGLGDEEAHALVASLRSGTGDGAEAILEVRLRSNKVTDEGARALGALLAQPESRLRLLDLRANCISRSGVQSLAEALERNHRVKHVYVHASGKIEALGDADGEGGGGGGAQLTAVDTICVVDVRENAPDEAPPAGGVEGIMIQAKRQTERRHEARATAAATAAQPMATTAAAAASGAARTGGRTRGGGRGGASGRGSGGKRLPKLSGGAPVPGAPDVLLQPARPPTKGELKREAGWQGRSAGLDVVPDEVRRTLSGGGKRRGGRKGSGRRQLPPLDGQ